MQFLLLGAEIHVHKVLSVMFGRTCAISLLSALGYYRSLRYRIGAAFQRASVEEHAHSYSSRFAKYTRQCRSLLREPTSKPLAGLIANKEMSEAARRTQQSLPFQAISISRYISLSGDFHFSRPFAANPTLQ